jgi:hypothetical protein
MHVSTKLTHAAHASVGINLPKLTVVVTRNVGFTAPGIPAGFAIFTHTVNGHCKSDKVDLNSHDVVKIGKSLIRLTPTGVKIPKSLEKHVYHTHTS